MGAWVLALNLEELCPTVSLDNLEPIDVHFDRALISV